MSTLEIFQLGFDAEMNNATPANLIELITQQLLGEKQKFNAFHLGMYNAKIVNNTFSKIELNEKIIAYNLAEEFLLPKCQVIEHIKNNEKEIYETIRIKQQIKYNLRFLDNTVNNEIFYLSKKEYVDKIKENLERIIHIIENN